MNINIFTLLKFLNEWRYLILVTLLLLIFSVVAINSARNKSATFDEGVYVTAGYSYWYTGDLRINPEHPPLAKLLIALPLLSQNISFSTQWKAWQESNQFPLQYTFIYEANDADSVLFDSRLVVVVLGALLGLLIWLWAVELMGKSVATYVLALYSTTPLFVAHSQLATLDLPLTVAMFLTMFLFYRSLNEKGYLYRVLTGLCMGAAWSIKFTALIVYPIIIFSLIICVYLSNKRDVNCITNSHISVFQYLVQVTAVALFVLWLIYLPFEGRGVADVTEFLVHQKASVLGSLVGVLAKLHFIPSDYAYGFLMQLEHRSHPAFLDGEYAKGGWAVYPLFAMMYKLPVPVLSLSLIGVVYSFYVAMNRDKKWIFVMLPMIMFVVVMTLSPVNNSLRYILPALPFLYLLVGLSVSILVKVGWVGRLFLASLLVYQSTSYANSYPNYLSYFNMIAGGSESGWTHLVDSDLDWGQGLPALKEWQDENGGETVYLSYFGTALPDYYNIKYIPLRSLLPLRALKNEERRILKKGDLVAISATNLQLVYFKNDEFMQTLTRLLKQKNKPIAIVGGSIFIYRL